MSPPVASPGTEPPDIPQDLLAVLRPHEEEPPRMALLNNFSSSNGCSGSYMAPIDNQKAKDILLINLPSTHSNIMSDSRDNPPHPPASDSPAPAPANLWSNRLRSSLRNLSKMCAPTYLPDGTPSVVAPEDTLLKSSEVWKNHIVAHFHGSAPSPAKIFSDLNPIWGRSGRISVKRISDSTVLILIPAEETRSWVLDVGFWQAGNCAFTVSLWAPSSSLAPIKLVSAPVWVILKSVPPQLYSLPGLSVIASAIGEPLYTEKSILAPNALGIAKVKIDVVLDQKLPELIRVTDKLGNSVLVGAEYPRLPPKCSLCSEFGHLGLRCPSPQAPKKLDTPKTPKHPPEYVYVPKNPQGLPLAGTKSPATSRVRSQGSQAAVEVLSPEVSSSLKSSASKARSTSLPSRSGHFSSERAAVVKRTDIVPIKPLSTENVLSAAPVTSSQFAEEAEIIKKGQEIVRARSFSPPFLPSPSALKKARRKLRQNIILQDKDSQDANRESGCSSSSAQPSTQGPRSVARGRSRSRQAGEKIR